MLAKDTIGLRSTQSREGEGQPPPLDRLGHNVKKSIWGSRLYNHAKAFKSMKEMRIRA